VSRSGSELDLGLGLGPGTRREPRHWRPGPAGGPPRSLALVWPGPAGLGAGGGVGRPPWADSDAEIRGSGYGYGSRALRACPGTAAAAAGVTVACRQ
jgi:hypothetical protein